MDKYEFSEIKNVDHDNFVIALGGHFTQGSSYGEWQRSEGRRVLRFALTKGEELISVFQIIRYALPFGKSYLYIPHGPIIRGALSKEIIEVLHKKFKEITKNEKAVFLRFDIYPTIPRSESSKILKQFFTKTLLSVYTKSFQPKFARVADLKEKDEEMRSKLHKKTLYNISFAERRGVTIEVTDELIKNFDLYYSLMKVTAERDGFHLHPESYYMAAFKSSEENKNGFFVIASYNGTPLICNFVLIFGRMAAFVFGGSSNEHRNLQPAYLLQWRSMLEAKKRGATVYNFGGVAPDNRIYKHWEGLTVFKMKFAGRVIEHTDFYDYISSWLWYVIYILRQVIPSPNNLSTVIQKFQLRH